MKTRKSHFFLLILLLVFFRVPQSLAEEVQDSIKIGVPSPLSGIYAADALGYRQCLEFAIEEINEGGGLLGRQLQMVHYDIGILSPEKLMAAAVVLIEQEKVDSIHGGWSGWGQNVRAFGRYKVPTFFADASISSINTFRKHKKQYNNIFQMCDVEKPLAVGVLDMMSSLDYSYPNRKIVVIATDDDWGYRIREAMETGAEPKGWKVEMSEVVPYGIQNWEPLLTKIRNINPAWIHLEVANPGDVKAFLNQFNQNPTQSLINLGYGLMPPNLIETLGNRADGLLGKVVFTMPLPHGPTKESKQWLQRFRGRYGNNPTTAGYLSYVSLKMWASAVTAVGDVKAYEQINNQLATMTFTGIEGGVWKFDKDHKIPMSKATPMLGMQVQAGQLVTICEVSDTTTTIHPFQKPSWVH